ncbi:MAG: hypothetical protein O7B24_03765 [Alphaproteobacteria bacterium]|nr:hypothetical protein [Alphaproteobacteria bacterium]
MIDYYGFVQGFAVLFIAVPLVVGAAAGIVWAWHKGRRAARLILPAAIGGIALTAIVFIAAVLFFRA